MRKYTPVLLLFSLTLICYGPIFLSFFQQDEWLAFGYHYLVEKQGISSFLKNAFIPRLGHFSPFNYIFEFFLFLLFRVNFLGWALVSTTLHFINSILVYKIAKSIFKKERLAWMTGGLFIVSASSYQATTWPVADIGTHGATLFALLSFYLWINKKEKYWIWAIASFGVALAFKETAVAMFALLPLWRLKAIKYLSILFILFILIRLLALTIPPKILEGTIYDQQPSHASQQGLSNFAYNLLTFPLKGVSQSIVPAQSIISISKSVANFIPQSISGQQNTTQRDNFVLKYLVEIFNFAIFLVILALALKSKKYAKYFLIFIMLNSVVYALSPERNGKITIIDSRNLYFLCFGSSILIISMLQKFARKKIVPIVILIILINFVLTFNQVSKASIEGKTRKDILTQIKTQNPILPEKTIFYFQSDSSYYGLPESEKILPFQSGLGQTLLVWYYQTEQFPPEFIQQKFLWEITAQGYKEVNGRGFGYFRDPKSLEAALESNRLDKNLVISYEYNSKKNILIKK